MLRILPTRLQQCMNCELPDVQIGLRKERGTRDQIANISWVIEKAREFQRNIFVCLIDYAKGFDCMDHNKLWKILKEMRIPDHLTCLLGNLYAGQKTTVRTWHGTTDSFQTGKGVLYIVKAVYCHPAYLTHMQSTSCKMPWSFGSSKTKFNFKTNYMLKRKLYVFNLLSCIFLYKDK